MAVQRRVAVGLVVAALIVGLLIFAFVPRGATSAKGECRGHTGAATVRTHYPVRLEVHGSTVLSVVDFDHRLWRAVDNRIATNGLAPREATAFDGSIVLMSHEQASFTSPAAFATFLTVSKADGCPTLQVVRAGTR